MTGERGQLLVDCLETPGIHPDLLARQDWLLSGIYGLLRQITGKLDPEATLPPPIKTLSKDWLQDITAYRRLLRDLKPPNEPPSYDYG